MEGRIPGRISVYWPERRYGFIVDFTEPRELFFHETDIIPTKIPPEQWRDVDFQLGKYRGRLKAVRIRILPQPADVLAGDGGAK